MSADTAEMKTLNQARVSLDKVDEALDDRDYDGAATATVRLAKRIGELQEVADD